MLQSTASSLSATRFRIIVAQIFPRMLGLLLLLTGFQKILGADGLRNVLAFDHFPRIFLTPLLWSIIILEIAIGLLLLIWPRRSILFAAIVLLALYTIQIIYLLVSHNAPYCNCIGGVLAFQNARRGNLLSLARNIFLITGAWLIWIQFPPMPVLRYSEGPDPIQQEPNSSR
jgi:uncharacterized membrane protein YphA (DoxX/SURF4 family)